MSAAGQLHQARADLELAERQIAALGTILAAVSFVVADALQGEHRQAKAGRQAARQARKKPKGGRQGRRGTPAAS